MANKKFYVDIDLQNNTLDNAVLQNTKVGSNGTMSVAGQFQYNSSNNRLEYVDNVGTKQVANLSDVLGLLDFKGDYNPVTDTPAIAAGTGVLKGDVYIVSTAGTFLGVTVEAGDMLIAEVDGASSASQWSIIQTNLDVATNTTYGTVKLATSVEIAAGTAGAYAVIASDLKNVVDTLNTAISGKVSKTGDTMSGPLNMGTTNKITNLADPTSAQDAATKSYVDTEITSAISGNTFVQDYAAGVWAAGVLTVTHNLNTSAPKVAAYDAGALIEFAVAVVDANTITLTSNVAVPATTKVGVTR